MSTAAQYNPTQSVEALNGTFKSRKVRSVKPAKAKDELGPFPVPALVSGRQRIEQAGAAVVRRIAEARVMTLEAIFDIGAQLSIIRSEVNKSDCGFEGKTPDQRYGAAIKELIRTSNHGWDLSSETLRKYRIISQKYASRKQDIISGQISIRSLFEASRTDDPQKSLETLLRGEELSKPSAKLTKALKAKSSELRSSSAEEFAETGKVYVASYHDYERGLFHQICGSREMAETKIAATLIDLAWFRDANDHDDEIMERTIQKVIKTIRSQNIWSLNDMPGLLSKNYSRPNHDVNFSIQEIRIDHGRWVDL